MQRRSILVTGGTKGIGRAVAERFAHAGDAVVVCGRRAPAQALPDNVRFVACDVGDQAQVKTMFAGLDRLDVLVNNAGITGEVRLDADDDALWHDIIATNLNGSYYCTKAAVPLLTRQGGSIVNIASVLGLQGVADGIGYCSAKHGVVGLTRATSHALARQGITVNAVCPGWVRTDMATQVFEAIGIGEADAAAGTPTGRITSPEEIADTVFWLASPATRNLTGQTIVIDGGTMA